MDIQGLIQQILAAITALALAIGSVGPPVTATTGQSGTNGSKPVQAAKAKPGPYADQFDRVVAAGTSLGKATSGQTYTTLMAAADGTVSVDGSQALVNMRGQFDWIAPLGRTQSGAYDFLIEWTPISGAPGLNVLLGGTTGTYMQTGFVFLASNPVIRPYEAIGAYATGLNRGYEVNPTSVPYTLGVEVSVRGQFQSGHLRMRVWQTGTAEPSTWDLDLTQALMGAQWPTFSPAIDSVEIVAYDQHIVNVGHSGTPDWEPQWSSLQIQDAGLGTP